ncbi:MAG: hypothetical protein KatS3mg115_0539 [Candidatus Poribacteria bacterium]|nr:MAG: hypothetical protein KatS3mg115_0539 [Candidatus Poribacteria bacterium]
MNAEQRRAQMVKTQIEARGIDDPRLLEAMRRVPRELFVPAHLREFAFDDGPLPIGQDQTISQPYIVAYMTDLLQLSGDEKVLEIGTGSGYQTAILAELAKEVYTVEILPGLAERARQRLQELGYTNVHFRVGDGSEGWPEEAPFDRILLTAAPARVPQTLLEQLKVGGILVAPVGRGIQQLVKIVREPQGYTEMYYGGVRFVPMTGKALEEE